VCMCECVFVCVSVFIHLYGCVHVSEHSCVCRGQRSPSVVISGVFLSPQASGVSLSPLPYAWVVQYATPRYSGRRGGAVQIHAFIPKCYEHFPDWPPFQQFVFFRRKVMLTGPRRFRITVNGHGSPRCYGPILFIHRGQFCILIRDSYHFSFAFH
jgi:hypothetical protein